MVGWEWAGGVGGKDSLADTTLLLHVRLAGVRSGETGILKTRRMGWLALPIILIFNKHFSRAGRRAAIPSPKTGFQSSVRLF
jgi:hypothetical protein